MRTAIRRLLPLLLLGVPLQARTAGYHVLKVDALYGVSEEAHTEAGLGLSLYSDDLAWWLTLGDPTVDDGHRVKQMWFEGRFHGPHMGKLPLSMLLVTQPDPEELEPPGPVLLPYRFWRLGTDHTTYRAFQWDFSSHLALNLPGLWGLDPERVLFGPTLGFGLELTWWDRWKDVTEKTINTGKVTAETGWVAGLWLDPTLYCQARSTLHYDLFGIHQVNLELAGLAGASLAPLKIPLGLEIRGEMDRGDDTFDTRPATVYTVQAALVYRLLPEDPDPEVAALLESLRSLMEEQARKDGGPKRSAPAPSPEKAGGAEDPGSSRAVTGEDEQGGGSASPVPSEPTPSEPTGEEDPDEETSSATGEEAPGKTDDDAPENGGEDEDAPENGGEDEDAPENGGEDEDAPAESGPDTREEGESALGREGPEP